MVPLTGLDLHFSSLMDEKLWSGTVKPSPVALIRAAFNCSSPYGIKKRDTPAGYPFSWCR